MDLIFGELFARAHLPEYQFQVFIGIFTGIEGFYTMIGKPASVFMEKIMPLLKGFK